MLFALPTLAANALQSLSGSVNAVWVGRSLGVQAIAATYNANMCMFLLFALAFGFGLAATVLVGQSIGAKDIAGARRAMGTALGFFAVISVVIAIVGWLIAPPLLHALGTPAEIDRSALIYLRIIFLAFPPMFLGLLVSMGLRGTGDSITPMIAMGVSVALDTLLNPLLIRGLGPFPKLGIAGSATATLIANYAVLLGLVRYVYVRDLPIRLRGQELRWLLPDRNILSVILRKGFPIALQMVVLTLGGIMMIGLVNREGLQTAAAYSVAQQMWTYLQIPAMAIGAAVSAMAAQNIGAGAWHRVDAITHAGLIANFWMTGIGIALMLVFDREIFGLFVGPGSAAVPLARHIQYLGIWNFLLFGATFVLFSAVRANGAVMAPLGILAFCIFVVRVAFLAIAYPLLAQNALWLTFPVTSAASLSLATLYYRYGRWRPATA